MTFSITNSSVAKLACDAEATSLVVNSKFKVICDVCTVGPCRLASQPVVVAAWPGQHSTFLAKRSDAVQKCRKLMMLHAQPDLGLLANGD